MNATISFLKYALILKYGICGIKIYMVVSTALNEIF